MAPPRPETKAWLLGPGWDLLLLANLTWPVIVGLAMWGGLSTGWTESGLVGSLLFWQVYFISTPHRWVTLGLVFMDEDKFQQRPLAFMGIGVFFVLFVTGVTLASGGTLLLVAIDFFWNAWHFAAQHSGISRIYNRMAHPEDQGRALFEKIMLRTFVLFVLFRAAALACLANCGETAISTAPVLVKFTAQLLPGVENETLEKIAAVFTQHSEIWLDWAMLLLPLCLLVREVWRFRPGSMSALIYMGSVLGLYITLLFSVRSHHTVFLLAVALATALFHATEYLGIVSFAVIRKHSRSSRGLLRHLAPRWGITLVGFILFLGVSAWMISKHYQNQWAVLTIAVSFLHYAYDGMIWKAPRKVARAPVT
jgi:hypothetical protein